jgi:hypothetical protein
MLTEEGIAELGAALKDYWSEGPAGRYLACRDASPDRNYLHVIAVGAAGDGSQFEADVFIPHRFVKLVVSSADRKHIGFL